MSIPSERSRVVDRTNLRHLTSVRLTCMDYAQMQVFVLVEDLSYEERLERLKLFSLEERRLCIVLIALSRCNRVFTRVPP